MELEWPVTKCENPECGYDLRESKPGQLEKGNDTSGRLIWNAHCPKCGRGYEVGYRVVPTPPAEIQGEQALAPVLSYVEDKTVKEVAPEENPDPEGLIGGKSEPVLEEKPEPGAIKPPGEGEYFCTKCAKNHKDTDKPKSIGLRHKKYREA